MKLIIFDFDGTLADTFEFVPEIVAKLAPEFGYKTPSKEKLEDLRNESAREIVKDYKISIFKLPKIVARAQEEIKAKIPAAKTFDNLTEVIQSLAKENKLAVISSNAEDNIKKFLELHKIPIQIIKTESALFGKAKAIKQLIKELDASKEDVVYIGDEVRDVEAAKKVGIKVVSVTWGYNKKEILAKYNDLLAEKPEDLLKIIG